MIAQNVNGYLDAPVTPDEITKAFLLADTKLREVHNRGEVVYGRDVESLVAQYVVELRERQRRTAAELGESGERLAAIKARLEAATPGPWESKINGNTVRSYGIVSSTRTICSSISTLTADAELIAHAPDDISFLLGLAEEREAYWATRHGNAMGEIQTLREQLAAMEADRDRQVLKAGNSG